MIILAGSCRPAWAEPSPDAVRIFQMCHISSSARDQEDCIKRLAPQAAQILQDAQSLLQHALEHWKTDSATRHAAQTALQDSDQAFVNYSQALCGFMRAARGNEYSSTLQAYEQSCQISLNLQRADFLRESAASLVFGH